MPVILMAFPRVVLETQSYRAKRALPFPPFLYGHYHAAGCCGSVSQVSPAGLRLYSCRLSVCGGVMDLHPLLLPQRARASRPRNRTRASDKASWHGRRAARLRRRRRCTHPDEGNSHHRRTSNDTP
ncbi:MAG: hypothetical protein ACREVH_12335 [Gammaproteobacteria bacterium]